MPVVARKPMASDLESSVAAVTPEIPFPVTVGERKPPAALPGWVVSGLEHTKQNENNLLESTRLVFQSGLFATREEALQDALSKAMQKLHANLMLRYPQYPINARKLTPDVLRYPASKRVYYRTIEHVFWETFEIREAIQAGYVPRLSRSGRFTGCASGAVQSLETECRQSTDRLVGMGLLVW